MADDQRKGFTPPKFQRNGPRPAPRPPAAPMQPRSTSADEAVTPEATESTPAAEVVPQTPAPPVAPQREVDRQEPVEEDPVDAAPSEESVEEHAPVGEEAPSETPVEDAAPSEEPTPAEEGSKPGWKDDARGRPNPVPSQATPSSTPAMSGSRPTSEPADASTEAESREDSSLAALFEDADAADAADEEHLVSEAEGGSSAADADKKGLFKTRKTRKPKRKRKDESPEDWPLAVPVPGGKLRNGRGPSLALRYGVLGGVVVISVGLLGVTAYGMGRASVPDVPEEVDSAVGKYGLTTFDNASAEAYAEDYIRTCLRRYQQTPEKPAEAEEKRAERLAEMSIAEKDPACEAGDTSKDVKVTQVRAIGKPQPIEGVDNARYITVQVTSTEPRKGRYSVPITLDNPEEGLGARVAGAVGVLPTPKNGSPKTETFPAPDEDENLGREWERSFIPEVMQAWVASDDLSQYLVSGATPAAARGLRGEFKNVKITEVRVVPTKGVTEDDDTGEFVYTEGDEVIANVDLTMTSEAGTTSGSTYRVTLRKQGEHWFVQDVEGGALGAGEEE